MKKLFAKFLSINCICQAVLDTWPIHCSFHNSVLCIDCCVWCRACIINQSEQIYTALLVMNESDEVLCGDNCAHYL